MLRERVTSKLHYFYNCSLSHVVVPANESQKVSSIYSVTMCMWLGSFLYLAWTLTYVSKCIYWLTFSEGRHKQLFWTRQYYSVFPYQLIDVVSTSPHIYFRENCISADLHDSGQAIAMRINWLLLPILELFHLSHLFQNCQLLVAVNNSWTIKMHSTNVCRLQNWQDTCTNPTAPESTEFRAYHDYHPIRLWTWLT